MIDKFYELLNLALEMERKAHPNTSAIALKTTQVTDSVYVYTYKDEWKPNETISNNEYAYIKYADYQVTMTNASIWEVQYPVFSKNAEFNIFDWLEDIKHELKGEKPTHDTYAKSMPQIVTETIEKVVENQYTQAKADILDKLLARKLEIGE